MSLPTFKSNIGKIGNARIPEGSIYTFKIKDEICRPQSDYPEKMLCLQLIEWQGGEKELRLGYYIIGKKPKMRGKWVWGQFASMMPTKDFEAIIKDAVNKGWVKI